MAWQQRTGGGAEGRGGFYLGTEGEESAAVTCFVLMPVCVIHGWSGCRWHHQDHISSSSKKQKNTQSEVHMLEKALSRGRVYLAVGVCFRHKQDNKTLMGHWIKLGEAKYVAVTLVLVDTPRWLVCMRQTDVCYDSSSTFSLKCYLIGRAP